MLTVCIEKCCFCIPLRMGTFILGYLITTLNIIELFITVVNATALKMIIQAQELKDPKMAFMKYMLYGLALIYSMQMVMGINLLVGLHKRKRESVEKFHKVYPVLMVIFYIILLISVAVNCSSYTKAEWLMHLFDLAVLLFQSYTVFVVYRCAKEMKNQEEEGEGDVYGVATDTKNLQNNKQSNV